MNSTKLKEIVMNIRTSINDGTFNEEDYISLKNFNKSLYELAIDKDNFDQEIFDNMVYFLSLRETGADAYETDVKVGKFMAARYIDPVVKNIPPKKN
jgi:hypothetical protein